MVTLPLTKEQPGKVAPDLRVRSRCVTAVANMRTLMPVRHIRARSQPVSDPTPQESAR